MRNVTPSVNIHVLSHGTHHMGHITIVCSSHSMPATLSCRDPRPIPCCVICRAGNAGQAHAHDTLSRKLQASTILLSFARALRSMPVALMRLSVTMSRRFRRPFTPDIHVAKLLRPDQRVRCGYTADDPYMSALPVLPRHRVAAVMSAEYRSAPLPR